MKEHKIAKIEVHLVSSAVEGGFADATRKVEMIGYTVVRVTTDTGIEGFGVTYHEVGGEATKLLIEKNIAPKLMGRNPFETEVIWQEMFGYLRGVGRKGMMFCALSAVDIALWDLKGKILDIPLYKLMGGDQTKVPVYGSGGWTSYTDDELVAEMKSLVEDEHYNMIKFKVGVEGGNNLRRDVERVRKVREAVGPEIGIMLDANNCWDAATGARFANRVKDYDIMFLEEPVFADDIPGLKKYKMSTDLPLATGEHEYTKFGARDLVLHSGADILQLDGTRAGGFTEMLKIAAITQAWNVKFAPHAMENIHIHLISACPNALFLERLKLFEGITKSLYKDAPLPLDGYMYIPDKPGLGLTLDMDFIKENDEKLF
ncbi:mandelate racemase/muconate lactonizing enzyme family protein [Blautia marasmi]|uniref:mandelate racemase/muconate lactonizing enzyme family protein n=1 Tax=Blautia marasmi TaxID=1917868 RepID=UPI000CF1CD0D|nr:mandelate racemase/muconate lactonizing enzyme family protein [Blautia marasmi]